MWGWSGTLLSSVVFKIIGFAAPVATGHRFFWARESRRATE